MPGLHRCNGEGSGGAMTVISNGQFRVHTWRRRRSGSDVLSGVGIKPRAVKQTWGNIANNKDRRRKHGLSWNVICPLFLFQVLKSQIRIHLTYEMNSDRHSHRHPSASTLLYNVTNGGEPPPEVGERESLLIMRQQQLQALWIEWGHKSKTDQSSDGGLGRCWFYSKEWQTTLHWWNARTPALPSRSFSIPVFVRNKLCSLFLASPLSALGRCII